MIEWIISTVLVTGMVYGVVIYNLLVHERQLTRSGWSDIGVQLKRRVHRRVVRPASGVAVVAAAAGSHSAGSREIAVNALSL
jgi:hypothetical protein